MAGAHIRIDLDDAAVRSALQRLDDAGADLDRPLRDVGEHLLNTTRERFRTQTDPNGNVWAPLSEVTRSRKGRNIDKILTQDGHLARDLNPQVSGGVLRLGSSRVYAAVHQFGAEKASFGRTSRGGPIPWGDIPARPFLGLSTDDREQAAAILREHLARATGGG